MTSATEIGYAVGFTKQKSKSGLSGDPSSNYVDISGQTTNVSVTVAIKEKSEGPFWWVHECLYEISWIIHFY